MDRSDARVRFQDADRLFQSKQYAAAIEILQDLNHSFPDERHILYPIARCLTGMKRYADARDIAERLVREFGYLPAQDLIDRIDRLESLNDAPIQTPVLPSGFDDIVVSPVSFGTRRSEGPAAAQPSRARWQSYAVWVSLLLGMFVVMLAVGLTVGREFFAWTESLESMSAEQSTDLSEIPPVPWSALLAVAAVNVVFGYLLACFAAYWALKVVDGLRFGDFGENMKHVAVTTLIGHLLTFVIVIGWIIFLVILKKRHELSLGRLFGAVLLYFIFGFLFSIPFAIVYNLAIAFAG